MALGTVTPPQNFSPEAAEAPEGQSLWRLLRMASMVTLTGSMTDTDRETDAGTSTDTDAEAVVKPAATLAPTSAPTDDALLCQHRADMAAAAERVWALYDAGVPLFTRDALQDVDRQLRRRRSVREGTRNASIAVRGLDGRQVRLTTQSGAISESGVHPDIVLVNIRPQIQYWTIEKLTGSGRWHVRHFQPAHTLLPLRIGHHREARYRNPADGTISPHGSSTVGSLATSLAQAAAAASAAEPAETIENAEAAKSEADQPPPHPPPLPSCSPLSADETRAVLRQKRGEWEASETCRTLRATLAEALSAAPAATLAIRSIVAFACASIADASPLDSGRHAVQHAMLLTVRDVVQELQGLQDLKKPQEVQGQSRRRQAPLPCFAQDPAYLDADIAALAEAGIGVVDDPHGFLAVDESTIVVAVAPSVPVRQIVADLARPAAMIWTRVPPAAALPLPSFFSSFSSSSLSLSLTGALPPPEIDNRGGWTDPASPRVMAMLRDSYAEWPFPDDRKNFGLADGMAIYVRTELSSQRLTLTAADDGHLTVDYGSGGGGGGLLQQLRKKLSCQWRA